MLKTRLFILSVFLIFFLFCSHTKTELVASHHETGNVSKQEDEVQQYLEDDI